MWSRAAYEHECRLEIYKNNPNCTEKWKLSTTIAYLYFRFRPPSTRLLCATVASAVKNSLMMAAVLCILLTKESKNSLQCWEVSANWTIKQAMNDEVMICAPKQADRYLAQIANNTCMQLAYVKLFAIPLSFFPLSSKL